MKETRMRTPFLPCEEGRGHRGACGRLAGHAGALGGGDAAGQGPDRCFGLHQSLQQFSNCLVKVPFISSNTQNTSPRFLSLDSTDRKSLCQQMFLNGPLNFYPHPRPVTACGPASVHRSHLEPHSPKASLLIQN